MSFKIGCAIWAYKGWVGDLFPPTTSASQFLQVYSRRLTTVECNSTFYTLPTPDMLDRWAKETPAEFEFCPKLPRNFTHDGALQPKVEAARQCIELMQRLGQRLGPIFAQLPPTYGPQSFADLKAFLSGLSQCDVRLALEVRHPQWFDPTHANQLNALLSDLGIGRVLLDSRPIYEGHTEPQVPFERRKPRLPLQFTTTASFSLIRYISHPNRNLNPRFMTDWVPHLRNWLQQGKQIYVFVHCPVEGQSPQNARLFQHTLEEQGIPIPPLPWNQVPPNPTQLTLF